ncbi:OmpA family protein [Nocardia mangyaensis]|uniref:OmpA family protein n=1 Tax=Nocardia mangyaensis TaxID=2213200 RepID=UPI002675543E|nr:OmpA family protein [Nocardia mangyaensis]MDO3645667.1 OmpA family protein [Nocardia mangyaensis]
MVATTTSLLSALSITGCTQPEDSPPTTVTIITTATSAEPLVALPESVVAEMIGMAKRAKRPGEATVHLVTSATGEVDTRDLVPLRPNGQVQHAQVDADRQIRAAIDDLAVTAAAAVASKPGLNVLPLFDRASQLPGDIHIITSGTSTEAPIDLRLTGWDTDPNTIVDSVERQGLLPYLPDRHVTFHGLGVVSGTQPTLPPFARSFIESLYLRLCEQAGAASCLLAPGAASGLPPIAALPVPVVPVPDAITEGGCPVWTRLSDTVLHFAPDSAVLPATANDALHPLVDAVDRCRIERIGVTGHIADTGTGDTRNTLAERRARAVADRLVVLGLPPQMLGMVDGRDAREPVVPNFTNDVFDEAKAQQNRRVELTFYHARR